MGNMQCLVEDAALLASVARSICPFPDYNPSPLLINMLSINSSHHLRDRYVEVQSSLSPEQLEDFNRGLRNTFGKTGHVTLGGVGVVALSLAVLFDTLARQARGERVSDSGPIPGLFLKDLSGRYPAYANTATEYLRLVPHVVNNPTRMREETERYLMLVLNHEITAEDNQGLNNEDVASANEMIEILVTYGLVLHLLRIANSTVIDEIQRSVQALAQSKKKKTAPTESTTDSVDEPAHARRCQKRHFPVTETPIAFSFNCDPEAANGVFLAEVHKSNDTLEAFKRCTSYLDHVPETWLHHIARLNWLDAIIAPILKIDHGSLMAQRESFDLKANALRKWAE